MARAFARAPGLAVRAVYWRSIGKRVRGRSFLDRALRLLAVCERHGVPLRAAALRFPFGHRAVASVLTGARTPEEVRDTAEQLRRPIPEALWDELRAEGLLDQVTPLLDAYRPTLAALEPAVTRMVQHLDDDEVQALITLVDRLPTLVQHLDEDVLPVLSSLENVAPDVHELRDTVQDLRQVVKGFPGSRLFRRRGAEEIAQEEAAQEEATEDDTEEARRPEARAGAGS